MKGPHKLYYYIITGVPSKAFLRAYCITGIVLGANDPCDPGGRI